MPAPPECEGARGRSPAAFERRRIPRGLRCSSVEYAQSAPSSRRATRAPRRSRCHAAFHHGLREPRSHPWIWAVYVFLFAASVPWYLPAGSPARLWLGLPHWVVISLCAYLAIAVFTAYVVARYWSVPPADEDADAPEDAA